MWHWPFFTHSIATYGYWLWHCIAKYETTLTHNNIQIMLVQFTGIQCVGKKKEEEELRFQECLVWSYLSYGNWSLLCPCLDLSFSITEPAPSPSVAHHITLCLVSHHKTFLFQVQSMNTFSNFSPNLKLLSSLGAWIPLRNMMRAVDPLQR